MNFTVRKKRNGDPPITKEELLDMLNNCGGFLKTAERLKLSKVTVVKYMRYYGIQHKDVWV